MSPRKRLDELTEERLVRTGVIRPSVGRQKTEHTNDYFIQTNWDLVFAMMEQVGYTARRIATMMLRDVNHFTNVYCGTQKEIQDELQLSEKPVKDAMVELQQVDFIRKYRNGRYMINPHIGIGCSKDYLPKLLDTFYSLQPYAKKKGVIKDAVRQSS